MSGSASPRHGCTRRHSRGFTYIGILLAVAFIGTGLAATGQLWSVAARRADEQDLLFAGDSFRRAIESYYRSGPARQYPRSLDDLVLDTRTTFPKRHLRKIYYDPVTRQRDWQLVTQGDGTIIGVASNSQEVPLKRANFARQDAQFEGAECYCDWKFVVPARLTKRRGTK
jgi:type II secretory pathway pseudopilin PulG